MPTEDRAPASKPAPGSIAEVVRLRAVNKVPGKVSADTENNTPLDLIANHGDLVNG